MSDKNLNTENKNKKLPLLRGIKSIYCLKIVFSHLSKTKRIAISKGNKHLVLMRCRRTALIN